MQLSKFTKTQIEAILKEADAGRQVNEIWRQYGISSAYKLPLIFLDAPRNPFRCALANHLPARPT